MSARKIVILNPKGGSGKTTIATNLAAYFASQGKATTLLDHDSQGSSTRWLNKRPEENSHIHGIPMYKSHGGVTRSFAQRIPNETQRIVVDTPASFGKHELLGFIQNADKIIVPVLPSDIDIHAATRTIGDLLLIANIDRRDNRLGIVANRVRKNTIVFRSLMRFLESLEIPVAGILRDTQNYIHAAQAGVGLHEMSRATLDKDLVQWKKLIRWLEPEEASPDCHKANEMQDHTNRLGAKVLDKG
jgi:chromosome partitioning protein